jgi:oligosaccharyltransferase complex subunit gamma
MKLQLQTAPVLLLYPPTTGPHASANAQPVRMDFLNSQSAEQTHNWIVRQLPSSPKVPYPKLVRPVNYTRIGASVTILIGLFTLGTVAYPYILPILQSRNLWAAASLIAILLFTSGHMFNHIRKVPYVQGSKGKIVYFANGFQSQYGMETQIVAAMCKLHPTVPF